MINTPTAMAAAMSQRRRPRSRDVSWSLLIPAECRTRRPQAALPGSIRITFGEAIGRVIFVTATDAAGKNHVVSAKMDPAKASRVLARTRDSRPGRYRVQWKVVATDGHAQAGTYTFTVKPGKS
jgi:methionine-rich copper-binding protein CopC